MTTRCAAREPTAIQESKGRNRVKGNRTIISVIAVVAVVFAMAGRSASVSKTDREKSRYYYYEGLRQMAADRDDAGYECFKRACQLDPDNKAAQYMAAQERLMSRVAFNDSVGMKTTMSMLRRYVDAYPDDIEEGIFYGYMAQNMDTTREGIRVLERLAERYPDNSNVLIYLSDAYSNHGQGTKAIEAMDRYEKLEGKSAPLTLNKMTLYMEDKDSLGAVREVDRLIASDPREYSYLILKGNLYEVLDKRDSAMVMYRKAEELAPESSGPKMALMEMYRQLGDSAAYDTKVYEVLLTEDLDLTQKVGLLSQYLQKLMEDKQNTERGDYLFSVLQTQYPHEADVLNLSARYNAAKGKYDEAAEQIGYAIDMDPGNPDYYRQKIYYLGSGKRTDDALAVYAEAEKHGAGDKNLERYCAMLLQNDDRYAEALSLYRKMVNAIDSGLNTDKEIDLSKDVRRDITMEDLNFLSDIITSMGDAAYMMKDTVSAYRDYRNALTLNPDNAMAANNYAYFSVTNGGDKEEALKLSEKSLRGDNAENPVYMDTYAWILYLMGRTDEALETQKKTIELMEKAGILDPEAMSHYADMLVKTGNKEEAIKYYQKALEQKPDNSEELRAKIEKAMK